MCRPKYMSNGGKYEQHHSVNIFFRWTDTLKRSICTECFHLCAQRVCKIIGAEASVCTRKVSLMPARLVGTPSCMAAVLFFWKFNMTVDHHLHIYVYIPLYVLVGPDPTSFVVTSWNSYSVEHSVKIL